MNNLEEGPGTDFRLLPPTVNLDGPKVRQIREAKGLTQLYVATAVGVTTDTISRWENRRYPSVKRENGLKLAEILEVDAADILEPEIDREKGNAKHAGDAEAQSGDGKPEGPEVEGIPDNNGENAAKPGSSGKKRIFIAIFFLLTAIAAGSFYLLSKPRKDVLEVTARRYLPDHSAPGQIFQLVIDVVIKPAKQRTLLVKDGDHQDIEFLRGLPAFTSRNRQFIKWIFQGELGYTRFICLARIKKAAATGEVFPFTGEITIKADKTTSIPLEGNNQVTAMPYSWADGNRDLVIDDEEILEAYDLLSGVKGAEKTLREVETLWSTGSYRWNRDDGKFQPVRKALKPKNTLK